MPYHYYFYFLLVFIVLIILIRFLRFRKRSIPETLFINARRNENDGDWEQALIGYESALLAIKKPGYQRSLRTKIIDKLQLLHTIIDYRRSLGFIR